MKFIVLLVFQRVWDYCNGRESDTKIFVRLSVEFGCRYDIWSYRFYLTFFLLYFYFSDLAEAHNLTGDEITKLRTAKLESAEASQNPLNSIDCRFFVLFLLENLIVSRFRHICGRSIPD